MRKIAGIMFVMLVAALVLVPALPTPVSAALGQDCTYDKVKWEDNPISSNLYLKNWGKTPLVAMSRLAGLAYPSILVPKACDKVGCAKAQTTGDFAGCGGCWGVSPAFANKSWGACDAGTKPSLNDKHPDHMKGDWGVTGCPHPGCVADSFCLPKNLCK